MDGWRDGPKQIEHFLAHYLSGVHVLATWGQYKTVILFIQSLKRQSSLNLHAHSLTVLWPNAASP